MLDAIAVNRSLTRKRRGRQVSRRGDGKRKMVGEKRSKQATQRNGNSRKQNSTKWNHKQATRGELMLVECKRGRGRGEREI